MRGSMKCWKRRISTNNMVKKFPRFSTWLAGLVWWGSRCARLGTLRWGGIRKKQAHSLLWKLLKIAFWFQPGGRPGPLESLPGGRHGPRHFQVLCLYTLGQETTFFLSGEFTATSSTRWHRPPFLTTAMTRFYAVRDSFRWAGNLLLENIAMEYFLTISHICCR